MGELVKNTEKELSKDVDIFRDTLVRYLGYSNEVGESFKALVHVNWVRFSYVVSTTYVCADAASKGKKVYQKHSGDLEASTRWKETSKAVADTFIWQGLASVIIPGFTINRICYLNNKILMKTTKLPAAARKWTVTAIGLGCIPLIIHPIDHFVDWLLDNSLRKFIGTK